MENSELIFKLKKKAFFEGTEYTEFDLSGLEELTGEDLGTLCKQAENLDGMLMIPEKSLTFAYLAASKVTGLPYDLFKKLSAKDTCRLRYTVSGFFLSED